MAENSWWKTETGIDGVYAGMFAVLFTPPDTVPCQVIKAEFFIDDRPAGFVVHIFDKDWVSMAHVPTVSTAVGWHEVDLSAENIVVSEDFAVAIKYTEANKPCLGVDQSSPDGRSYSIESDGSVRRVTEFMAKGGDWLIRVVVRPFDTDGDGLYDYYEREIGTDPNRADGDGDGLTDVEELELGTSPTKSDTDGDSLYDKTEIDLGADPFVKDTDGDGLDDQVEVELGINPLKVDTDGDYWDDPIDMVPTNTLIPNLLIVVALAIIGGSVLLIIKRKPSVRLSSLDIRFSR